MLKILTKFSTSPSSSLQALRIGGFRRIAAADSVIYGQISHLQFNRKFIHHAHAVTAMEPSLREQIDELSLEINNLGETIREMKGQMKKSNSTISDKDKMILETKIASLLEMKDRYSDMQKAIEESHVAVAQNVDDGMTTNGPKNVDTSNLSIRPSLDDVERISKGQAAKRRGTGSRAVPHRLNEMERKEW